MLWTIIFGANMSSCAVKSCKNYPKKKNKSHGNITYHVFPKDGENKSKWIDATGRDQNWFPTSKSTICSEHFENDCFIEKERILLKQGSIPTLKLVDMKQLRSKKKSTRSTKPINSKKTSTAASTGTISEIQPVANSNCKSTIGNPLQENIDDPSQSTNNADESQKIKKLIREKEYYKSLSERRKLIIKATKQRNRRLLKKIMLMQVLLHRQKAKSLGNEEKEKRRPLATSALDPLLLEISQDDTEQNEVKPKQDTVKTEKEIVIVKSETGH